MGSGLLQELGTWYRIRNEDPAMETLNGHNEHHFAILQKKKKKSK